MKLFACKFYGAIVEDIIFIFKEIKIENIFYGNRHFVNTDIVYTISVVNNVKSILHYTKTENKSGIILHADFCEKNF